MVPESHHVHSEARSSGITGLDYAIFTIMLAVSTAIGVFFGFISRKKQKSSRDVLLANSKMGVFPTAMSLMASFMSGITILGNPAEQYNYGSMFLWSVVAHTLTACVVSYIFIPLFMGLHITSAYEYLEKRFNRYVKLLASIFFLVQMTIYMGIVLYAPALAINQVTGFNIWYSVISIGSICTFYTAVGGMKAVMWTDVFQVIVMLFGLGVSIWVGTAKVGGLDHVLETNLRGDRIQLLIFDPNPTVRHTVWGLSIGLFFQWLSVYGTNQSQVQRYLSTPNVKTARRAIFINLIGLYILCFQVVFVGMIIYTRYETCDPVSNCEVKNSDQLYPHFVMDAMGETPGFLGLFMACLFSAALSTISSGLNSLCCVSVEIVASFIKTDMTDEQQTRLAKLLCVLFGLLCLAITYVVSFLGAILQAALSLFGIIGGPILGLFCLGIFVPFCNSVGAVTGTLTGMAFTVWIFLGKCFYDVEYEKKSFLTVGCPQHVNHLNRFNQTTQIVGACAAPSRSFEYEGLLSFHSISYTWYGCISVWTTILVGCIVSLITGPLKQEEVNPKYILPFFDKLFPFLPAKIKRALHFGYKYTATDNSEMSKHHQNQISNHHSSTVSQVHATEMIEPVNSNNGNLFDKIRQRKDGDEEGGEEKF